MNDRRRTLWMRLAPLGVVSLLAWGPATLLGGVSPTENGRSSGETEASASPTAAEASISFEDLSWLAGHWRGEHRGVVSEEVWLRPEGGLMVGMHRDVRGEGGTFFEYLRIEESEEGVTYWASPKGREATPFRLVQQEGRRVVFENPDHDFPQRILYWLDDEGLLHARVEADVDGGSKGSEWVWERVPAPAEMGSESAPQSLQGASGTRSVYSGN